MQCSIRQGIEIRLATVLKEATAGLDYPETMDHEQRERFRKIYDEAGGNLPKPTEHLEKLG